MSASKAKADLGLWPGEVRGIVKQTSRLAHTVAGGSIQYAREEISELVKVATAFVELGPTRTPTDGKPSKKTVNVQKLEALTHALSAALEGLEQSAGLLAFRRAEGANEHTRLEHAVLHCFLRLRNHEEVVQEMCKRVAASKTNLATFQKLVAEQTPDMDYVGAAATLEQYVHNGFREASASHAVGEEKAASISELQVCTRQNRGESFSNRATNLRNNVISPALAAAVESSVSELPALARHNAKQTRSKVLRGKATIPRMYRELTVACTVVFLLCVLLLFQMVDSSKVFSKQESGMIAVMWLVAFAGSSTGIFIGITHKSSSPTFVVDSSSAPSSPSSYPCVPSPPSLTSSLTSASNSDTPAQANTPSQNNSLRRRNQYRSSSSSSSKRDEGAQSGFTSPIDKTRQSVRKRFNIKDH